MKAIDIALKDMLRSFRSKSALMFMFGIPLLVTSMFYLMFGRIANQGEFNLPRTKVVIANQDRGGPRFQVSTKHIPGGVSADTMGELVVGVLTSEEMADLIEVSLVPDATAARAAVDSQQAQVAVIIPPDFSQQFADVYGQATIEFYQDPTLTIGPGIVRSILNQFMDGMAGVKIAVNVALDQVEAADYALVSEVVRLYMETSLVQDADPETALMEVRSPSAAPGDAARQERNLLLSIVSPIVGGIMVMYAFFTGATTAQSIIREDEERTLPRLFTTPTSRAAILGGKFLAVFLTVLVQVIVLLSAARLIFGIQWGAPLPVALNVAGIVCASAAFGIFANSLLKSTRQGGAVIGGGLTMTGMLGMIGSIGINSPTAQKLSNSVSLLVPQGWAVRGLLQTMQARPPAEVLVTTLVLLAWSVAFFVIGVWRFNRRYA